RSHVDSLSLFYIAALRWICYAYVAALSMMSLVVSVLEDNISGFRAINRASGLMKGKQIQASIAMMLYYTACL
nr:dual specificity protein kinase [Tanacetum cinerariifolium]